MEANADLVMPEYDDSTEDGVSQSEAQSNSDATKAIENTEERGQLELLKTESCPP